MTFDRESGVYEALRRELRKFTPLPQPDHTGNAISFLGGGDGGAPSVVVASVFASDRSKARADYQCVGSNDQDVIQAAINSLVSEGGRVLLTEGEFNVTVPVGSETDGAFTVLSGVSLIGMGKVISSFGTTIASTGSGSGLGSVIYVPEGSVENLEVTDNGDATLIFTDSDEALIRNVYLDNGTGNGITLDEGANKITVEGCTFNTGTPGDSIHASDAAGTSFGLRIINNHFIFGGGNAIYLGGSTSAVITGNTIEDSDLTAFSLEDASNATVADNIIKFPGNHGIQLAGCDNCDIHDNTITNTGWVTDNTYDTIHLSGDSNANLIQGNVFVPKTTANQPRYGINISASTCDDNVVVGNYLGIAADYATLPLNDAGTNTVIQYPSDPVLGSNITDGTSGSTPGQQSNIIPFSEGGTLTTGTGVSKIPFTLDATIVSVQLAVDTSPTDADLIVDVNKNAVTIFTTQGNRPTVPAADADGVGAEATPDITSITAGEFLTVDIDQIGSTIAGADLVVSVEWKPA